MFYIRDCYGNIVGNPKGYKTHKAADIQTKRRGSPAFNAIWNNFNLKSDADDLRGIPASGRLIFSITGE